jgi:hypothetical protein
VQVGQREQVRSQTLAGSISAQKKIKPNGTGDRAVIDEIKVRLDMVAYAGSKLGAGAIKQGSEYRFPGSHGFLINLEKGCWYHHGGQYGGDALDLVGYLLYGSTWNRQNATMFKDVLHESAFFSKVSIPDATVNTATLPSPMSAQSAASKDPPTETAEKVAPAIKFDLLDVARC